MIRPLADRVVIEPKAAETKTASGLYIPDTAKEKPQQGIVVAAGPGKKDEPMELKVGDTVIYGKYAGTEVSVEGVDKAGWAAEDWLVWIFPTGSRAQGPSLVMWNLPRVERAGGQWPRVWEPLGGGVGV